MPPSTQYYFVEVDIWKMFLHRRHLALQKLDSDQTNDDDFLRKFHRNSKHEITAAEWAICDESQEYCAIATSQLIEVVTWRSSEPSLIHSLRAHTRVITDIDWHSKTPYLLASCSIDTFTHLWDLRDPKKPTMSLSAVCMCKWKSIWIIYYYFDYWNDFIIIISWSYSSWFQSCIWQFIGNGSRWFVYLFKIYKFIWRENTIYQLFVVHIFRIGDLRIWDVRKGSCPIQYITAHLARYATFFVCIFLTIDRRIFFYLCMHFVQGFME